MRKLSRVLPAAAAFIAVTGALALTVVSSATPASAAPVGGTPVTQTYYAWPEVTLASVPADITSSEQAYIRNGKTTPSVDFFSSYSYNPATNQLVVKHIGIAFRFGHFAGVLIELRDGNAQKYFATLPKAYANFHAVRTYRGVREFEFNHSGANVVLYYVHDGRVFVAVLNGKTMPRTLDAADGILNLLVDYRLP